MGLKVCKTVCSFPPQPITLSPKRSVKESHGLWVLQQVLETCTGPLSEGIAAADSHWLETWPQWRHQLPHLTTQSLSALETIYSTWCSLPASSPVRLAYNEVTVCPLPRCFIAIYQKKAVIAILNLAMKIWAASVEAIQSTILLRSGSIPCSHQGSP